jgi:RNAse (barnase) inhibitor barstar
MSAVIVLDGKRIASAADVYRALAPAIRFPRHFGENPDALWDVLSERGPIDLSVTWRDAACSARRLRAAFPPLVTVLQAADAAGLLSFELA